MLEIYRRLVQHLCFTVLTYGGRFGVHLGYALPCLSCPFVTGCGGGCYLMALQGYWLGLQMSLVSMISAVGLEALWHLVLFIVLILLLGKLWCGWICPFGLLQDWLSMLRQKLGIAEAQIDWLLRDRIKIIKYLLLVYLLLIPLLIAHAGLHPDFGLPFCQICPAKPIMPLFAGETRHFALDFTNSVTLIFSILSVAIAGAMLVVMFFKDRFFCILCPMLAIIHLFRRISLPALEKKPSTCLGCATCQRLCPMDIRRVHEEREDKNVEDEDCLNCLQCVDACPSTATLWWRWFRWPIFFSSRKSLIQRFGKGARRHV